MLPADKCWRRKPPATPPNTIPPQARISLVRPSLVEHRYVLGLLYIQVAGHGRKVLSILKEGGYGPVKQDIQRRVSKVEERDADSPP